MIETKWLIKSLRTIVAKDCKIPLQAMKFVLIRSANRMEELHDDFVFTGNKMLELEKKQKEQKQ